MVYLPWCKLNITEDGAALQSQTGSLRLPGLVQLDIGFVVEIRRELCRVEDGHRQLVVVVADPLWQEGRRVSVSV